MKNAIQKSLEFTTALVTPQCLCAGYSAQKQRGFTLIELLVVVLIIGILAAVALPQYQKAVAKSRAIEIVSFLDAARKSLDLYMLANGIPDKTFLDCSPTYGITTNNLDELDLSLPIDNFCENFYTTIGVGDSEAWIYLTTDTDKFDFDINFAYINNQWELSCFPFSSIGLAGCQNFKSFPNYSCYNPDEGKAC